MLSPRALNNDRKQRGHAAKLIPSLIAQDDKVLSLAGSTPNITSQDILDRLEQRKDGRYLIVEGCRFSSARRCREAIKRIATSNGITLRDQR
jgi:hypothetical protein